MKHRIFIAINLPEDIKKRLSDFQRDCDSLFEREGLIDLARWTKRNSLHLTLVFIGYVTDQQMANICQITKQIAKKSEPFYIDFEKIIYGPPNKPPRMIWVEGGLNQGMVKIKKELEDAFLSLRDLNSFRPERRVLSPHITLARLKEYGQTGQLPNIQRDFRISMAVNSIEVMESDLRRDGAEYIILEECPLAE